MIPPTAEAVMKIKNLNKVELPGGDLKAARPIKVNAKNKTIPQRAPIKIPFFFNFFAPKNPAKKEPIAIANAESSGAEETEKIPNDIIKANNIKIISVAPIPHRLP